jgi:hypothetical protein
VVENYGSDVPNWDQWDAEGVNLLLPWSQGKLHVLDLFAPHNEHRVALTKLVALGRRAGEWSMGRSHSDFCELRALHSALAVALWFWVRPLLLQRWQRLLWALALAGDLRASPRVAEHVGRISLAAVLSAGSLLHRHRPLPEMPGPDGGLVAGHPVPDPRPLQHGVGSGRGRHGLRLVARPRGSALARRPASCHHAGRVSHRHGRGHRAARGVHRARTAAGALLR